MAIFGKQGILQSFRAIARLKKDSGQAGMTDRMMSFIECIVLGITYEQTDSCVAFDRNTCNYD
jgi:hypothetical protein